MNRIIPMMKCGHAANSTNMEGKPSCAICFGFNPLADQIDENPTPLTSRKAKCSYCNIKKDSSTNLAFFESRPQQEMDRFYCGCLGWN